MEENIANKKGNRSLQRAIDILNCFDAHHPELTLTEIAEKTELAKSTVTRLLTTLEWNSFIEKDPKTLRYKLGKQLILLGENAGRSFQLEEQAEMVMHALHRQTKETVHLYVPEGKHRVCIKQLESPYSVKHIVRLGEKQNLSMGASGKVFLAYQSSEFVDQIINEEKPRKEKRILMEELDVIRKEKFSESTDENEKGISAVASPIFNSEGKVVASISISGPSNRFIPSERPEVKELLTQATREVSNKLGFVDEY